MRVVIAPDSFKGSIGAAGAAAALAAGWRTARPGDEVLLVPLADGGEGTLDVLAAAVPGARWHTARVTGPGGDPADCPWLELPDGTAAVELARASGLPMLARLDPLGAQTTGLGEVIGQALDAGARRLVIALGGSASTDGGAGALSALGARFTGAAGQPLTAGGGALRDLAAADLAGLRPPPAGGVSCLSDVRAPLLGPGGAAAVFGPQKGASPAQVAQLEHGLARLAGVLGGDPAAPGAGRGRRHRIRLRRRLGRGHRARRGLPGPAGWPGPGGGWRGTGHHRRGPVRPDLSHRQGTRDGAGRRGRGRGGRRGRGRPGRPRRTGPACPGWSRWRPWPAGCRPRWPTPGTGCGRPGSN